MEKPVATLTSKTFGQIEGRLIYLHELKNKHGMRIQIMDYGATITSISIPSKSGDMEVVCGFNRLEDYLSKTYAKTNPYFGCTVGRVANRIKDGRFDVDGDTYQLAINNGTNHLHGGITGFDKRIWESEVDGNKLKMTLISPHLDEGYPGELKVSVTYELTDKNELHLSFHAAADQKTPVSLTNHSYFNLTGFEEDIENHSVRIDADYLLEKDDSACPTGKKEAVLEATDFRNSKKFSESLRYRKEGLDDFYLFNKSTSAIDQVAFFHAESRGVSLDLLTTEPGMQLYTANVLDGSLSRGQGHHFNKRSAFCCETHRYPNGPNIENSPGSFIDSDHPYESKTIYRFSWE